MIPDTTTKSVTSQDDKNTPKAPAPAPSDQHAQKDLTGNPPVKKEEPKTSKSQ